MATIALVQSYPYDAFLGGDGTYSQCLAQYLSEVGHEVHGLLSNVTRGRRTPIYRSAYPIEQYSSWRVRKAYRVGRRTFVAPHRNQPKALLAKILPGIGSRSFRLEASANEWAPAEAAWVSRELQKLRAHAAILCYGAVHFAPFLSKSTTRIFALPGFIGSRNFVSEMTLGKYEVVGVGQYATIESQLSEALRSADCTGFNNLDDTRYAVEHLGINPVMLVGIGFRGQARYPESNKPIVLFVGNDTPANRQAVSWLVSKIWPIVQASFRTATLRLVGKIARVEEAAGDRSVERVGPVQALSSEYSRAQIVVAPLLSGTAGVKIKVAEAMSYGRPLVTTPVGVDPSDVAQLNEGAIVADNTEDFARAVISLLTDRQLRREKTIGAVAVFEKYFSCTAAYGPLLEWIEAGSGSPRE
jgi:glycosyltransferase involved in cell wall biosynthesis